MAVTIIPKERLNYLLDIERFPIIDMFVDDEGNLCLDLDTNKTKFFQTEDIVKLHFWHGASLSKIELDEEATDGLS